MHMYLFAYARMKVPATFTLVHFIIFKGGIHCGYCSESNEKISASALFYPKILMRTQYNIHAL